MKEIVENIENKLPVKQMVATQTTLATYFHYSPLVCRTCACSPDWSCIFFPLFPPNPFGFVPIWLGWKCFESFFGLLKWIPSSPLVFNDKKGYISERIFLFQFYSAFWRRFSSIFRSIFSNASTSFNNSRLFSNTNSAKERLRILLISFTFLYCYHIMHYFQKRFQLWQLFENLFYIYSYEKCLKDVPNFSTSFWLELKLTIITLC